MKWRLLPDDPDIGYTPYFWLVYFGIYWIYLALWPYNTALIVIQCVVAAVFLVLYFRGFWVKNLALIPVLTGLTGLGVVMSPINPGATAFFIFAAGFLGAIHPVKHAYLVLAIITAIAITESLVLAWPPYIWLPAVLIPSVIGIPNIYFSERQRLVKGLVRAQEEVASMARIAERERIARDLHDLLGHTLSVIVLKAELAGKLLDANPQRSGEELGDIESIARKALEEVRQVVHGYRQMGLTGELARASMAAKAAGLVLTKTGQWQDLPAALEHILALIFREAITNVMRHANASHCQIEMLQDETHASLVVHDNGRGISGAHYGTGVLGMQERAAAAGGQLRIETDGGTKLTATVPITTAAASPVSDAPGSESLTRRMPDPVIHTQSGNRL